MADSPQIREQIVSRLLQDADLLSLFLQDPDGVLAGYPDLDRFDARYLKDKIEDWGSLTAVARRWGIEIPERPSAAPSPADLSDDPPRLQLALHLRDDPLFFALYQKDPVAALAAYPDLEEDDAQYIQDRVTDAASLQEVINRYQTTVQSADSGAIPPPPQSKGIDFEPPPRVVNTGFAAHETPTDLITAFKTPLAAGKPYFFWLQIGELMAEGLAQEVIELPADKLPPEARLTIALFAYDGELMLTGAERGEIQLAPEGPIRVTRRAAEPAGVPQKILEERLYFAFRTMDDAGYGRLRCNIYYQNTLVQSHLVVARVAPTPTPQPFRILWHASDYTLSKSLDSEQLVAMGQNSLSLMINTNDKGTHGFRFMGEQDFQKSTSLGEGEIAQMQGWARGALRQATWGDENEHDGKKDYLYEDKLDLKKLKTDLILMARGGHHAFTAVVSALAGEGRKIWQLMDWMKKPGQVQIATRENTQIVVPAAMFYDYPFLAGDNLSDYSVCPGFLDALKGDKPLEACACFQGDCPSYDEEMVVCPSGFWGFRHFLGLPVSVKDGEDTQLRIGGSSTPSMAVSVYKDFDERDDHEKRLKAMGLGWEYAESRNEALDMLKVTEAQIIYFYCHGGLSEKGMPYLQLGDEADAWFMPGNLLARRIWWEKTRPLVFINGCHTTQVTPERALDFVSSFVEISGALGVIGTEITIFEPLAVEFAEECLRRFLFEKQTVGEAVRGARLHLLKKGNPLGLVYIPYALPALKLA